MKMDNEKKLLGTFRFRVRTEDEEILAFNRLVEFEVTVHAGPHWNQSCSSCKMSFDQIDAFLKMISSYTITNKPIGVGSEHSFPKLWKEIFVDKKDPSLMFTDLMQGALEYGNMTLEAKRVF